MFIGNYLQVVLPGSTFWWDSLRGELRRDLDAGLGQALHRRHRTVEHLLFALVELDLDDALDAAGADHHGNADIGALDAILAGEVGRTGQQALLVLEIGFGHGNRRGRRRVIGRAGLEQADDLGAAVTGALHDLVELLLRGPAHLDEVG